MPAPKPSKIADWDTSLANLLDFTAGQVIAGWANGQVVASNNLNSWMNIVGQWTDYLRDFEIQAHTWTAQQVFQAGILLSLPSFATAGIVATPTATTYALIDYIQLNGVAQKARQYSGSGLGSDRVFTQNCFWNDSSNLWTADSGGAGIAACMIKITHQGVFIYTKAGTASTWADNAWDAVQTFGDLGSPALTLQCTGGATTRGTLNLTKQAAPGTQAEGDCYVDTADNTLKFYDGTVWRTVGGHEPITDYSGSLANGWSGTFAVYLTAAGRAQLKGSVANSGAANSLVALSAAIAAKYRPAVESEQAAVALTGAASSVQMQLVDAKTNGVVYVATAGAGVQVSLDGISWDTF